MAANRFDRASQAGIRGFDSGVLRGNKTGFPRNASEIICVYGEEAESSLASKIALDPALYRKLQAIMSPVEAQAWVRAERDEGEAPTVRRREAGKAWRRHPNVLVDPAREDFDPEADATLDPHAKRALDLTTGFIQKHGGTFALRPDHGTANHNPSHSHDESHHAPKRALLDNIVLAEARLTEAEDKGEVMSTGSVSSNGSESRLTPRAQARVWIGFENAVRSGEILIEGVDLTLPSAEIPLLSEEAGVASLDAMAEEEARRDRASGLVAFTKYGLNRADQE